MQSRSRIEKDSHHAADACVRTVAAQGSEPHACGEADDLAHASHARAASHSCDTMKRYAFQGGSMTCPSPKAANSVRCVRVAELLADEVSDLHDFFRSQLEGEASVSQPDAQASIDHMVADLSQEDLLGLAEQGHAKACGDGKTVCSFAQGALVLTPNLWAAVLVRFHALGRMLTEEELHSVVVAEGGHDDDR